MVLGAFVVEHRWKVEARERRKHVLLKKVRAMGAKAAKTLMLRRQRKGKSSSAATSRDDDLLSTLALTKNVNWDVIDEVGGSLWDQHRRILRPKPANEIVDNDHEAGLANKTAMTWMDAFGLDTDGMPYDVSPDSILRSLLRQSAAHFRASNTHASDSTAADSTPRVRLAAAVSPPDGGQGMHTRRMSRFTRSDNANALLQL